MKVYVENNYIVYKWELIIETGIRVHRYVQCILSQLYMNDNQEPMSAHRP